MILIAYLIENLKWGQEVVVSVWSKVSILLWRHYFIPKEFVFYIVHCALQLINDQGKLSLRHMDWAEFIQIYSFILKHGSGKSNWVVDALSWMRWK